MTDCVYRGGLPLGFTAAVTEGDGLPTELPCDVTEDKYRMELPRRVHEELPTGIEAVTEWGAYAAHTQREVTEAARMSKC